MYPWKWRRESESRDVAWVADQAGEFFQRAQEEGSPFFLIIGYVDPHRDVRTRGGFGNQAQYDLPVKSLRYKPDEVEVPPWLPDLPETRRELAEYYEAINRTDQGVGFVLDDLARRGLMDQTLIIFTSDNGPPFMNAKTTLYDAGTCLPFVVRVPGGQRGVVNPNMISHIDILPTLLEYAGIVSRPIRSEYLQVSSGIRSESVPSPPRRGRSFLSILQRTDIVPEKDWQHHVFGSHTFHELQNYWPTRVCRTRRYKYHRNIAWKLDFPFATDLYASYSFEAMRRAPGPLMIGNRSFKSYLQRPAEELFDLEEDPDETQNLAGDAAHADILKELRDRVERWQLETRDLWLFRDGHSVRMMQAHAAEGLLMADTFDMQPQIEGQMKPLEELFA